MNATYLIVVAETFPRGSCRWIRLAPFTDPNERMAGSGARIAGMNVQVWTNTPYPTASARPTGGHSRAISAFLMSVIRFRFQPADGAQIFDLKEALYAQAMPPNGHA